MRLDVTKLTPEARKAIVECLKIAAHRGRQLREEREREQRILCAESAQEKTGDATDKRSPPEGQSQQVVGNQQEQSDPHSVALSVDAPSTDASYSGA